MAGKGGGQPGNKNSTKNKIWGDQIRLAVKQDPEKLRKIALKLLEMAEAGDMAAIRELGDRLDGKPKQETELASGGGVIYVPVHAREKPPSK